MLNLGLVGLGFMAATHIKALRQVPGVRVAALCNPSGRHLDGDFTGVAGNVGDNAPVKLEPGSFRAFRDYAAMLADPDIHAVDICAPTLAHHDLAIAALRAGKHVLCEKPFARTAAQAREMAAVAAESNRILMPAMCLRFFPEWVWVKTAIADGRFGQVLSARFRRVAEPPGWGQQNFLDGAKSGGALLDLHIHDTDFVQFCFGRPRAVRSSGHTKISGAIDHVVTEYEVAGGAMVHAEGAWCMTPGFGFNMSYTVNFERATVDYDLPAARTRSRSSKPDKPRRCSNSASLTATWVNCATSPSASRTTRSQASSRQPTASAPWRFARRRNGPSEPVSGLSWRELPGALACQQAALLVT